MEKELNLEQPITPNESLTEEVVAKEVQPQTSATEDKEEGSKIGKFKDVDALYTAYNNLQSDYTKKCQALSLLEQKLKDKEELSTPDNEQKEVEKVVSTIDRNDFVQEYVFRNEDLKDKILARYFDEINIPKSPKLIASDRGSAFVLSPNEKPKTFDDAGKLAKNLLNNK